MYKKCEILDEYYRDSLFLTDDAYDQMRKKQQFEEKLILPANSLKKQNSIIEKAKSYIKQRTEYKKSKLSRFRSLSIEMGEILETNRTDSFNKTKLDSPAVQKFKFRNSSTDSKSFKLNQVSPNVNNNTNSNTNNIFDFNSNRKTVANFDKKSLNNNENKEELAFIAKPEKIKNPLRFEDEEFTHKYDLVNIIPQSSILKIDEKKFLSKGETNKLFDVEYKSKQKRKKIDKNLTPFEKNLNCKMLLKENLTQNKEILGEKGTLIKRSYDNLKSFDNLDFNNAVSSCTIYNFGSNKNKKNNLKEILLSKYRKDKSLIDFEKTSKEILPNIGYNAMSTIGFGYINEKFNTTKSEMFAKTNYMFKLQSQTKSNFNKAHNTNYQNNIYSFNKEENHSNHFKNNKMENQMKDEMKTIKQTQFFTSGEKNFANNIAINSDIQEFDKTKSSFNKINPEEISNSRKKINLVLNKVNLNDDIEDTSLNIYKLNEESKNTNNYNSLVFEIHNNHVANKNDSIKRDKSSICKNNNLSANCDKNNNYNINDPLQIENNIANENSMNFDESACQTVENEENKMGEIIKSNKNNKINQNDLTNINNKLKNLNLNFNTTHNTKFLRTTNTGAKNIFKKTYENFTSTENDYKMNPYFINEEKLVKIDYDEPAQSANDILSLIIRTNRMKEKTIDPLLTNQRFITRSHEKFSSLKNQNSRDIKNFLIKKGTTNINDLVRKNITKNFNFDNYNGNDLKNNTNSNTINNNEKCNITNTNLNESFIYRGSHQNGKEDNNIPIRPIFKPRFTSFYKKFKLKKNKF